MEIVLSDFMMLTATDGNRLPVLQQERVLDNQIDALHIDQDMMIALHESLIILQLFQARLIGIARDERFFCQMNDRRSRIIAVDIEDPAEGNPGRPDANLYCELLSPGHNHWHTVIEDIGKYLQICR